MAKVLEFQLQHHSLQRNPRVDLLQNGPVGFFIVQLSHPYMTTGETIVLTRWTFVGKVMSLLLNMLSRLVITFLPRSNHVIHSFHFKERITGFPTSVAKLGLQTQVM